MLTYTPADIQEQDSTVRPEKPWLLLLLCLVWLIPGLIGHDPWKPDENQTAAVVARMLSGGGWSVPRIAEDPYLLYAPLYYWISSGFAWLTSWVGVAIHDAARLASGFLMATAMWGVGLASRELNKKQQGRIAVIILIGCVGMVFWGHHASPATLGLCGFAWQIYALALSLRRPFRAGVLLGMAWLILALGTNWAECLLALLLTFWMLVFARWRQTGFIATVLTALTISVPIASLWPLWLRVQDMEAYRLWTHHMAWGIFNGPQGIGFFHAPGFLPSVIAWFCWPALPLACWSAWVHRRTYREPQFQLVGLQSIFIALWLIFAADLRDTHVLYLLIPLSIMGAAGVDELRRSAAAALNWFGMMTFSILGSLLWIGWLILIADYGKLAERLYRENPYYVPSIGMGTFFACIVTLAWISILLKKRSLGRRSVTIWSCGLTLIWCLFTGLWQQWLDTGKSYRSVAQSLRLAIQDKQNCIRVKLGDAQAAGLAYFSGLHLDQRGPDSTSCLYYLRQDVYTGEQSIGRLIWMGSRPGEEHGERFYLYQSDVSSLAK